MDASSTQNYIELLEKTNQQLSLWYNPYGFLVGILTLLITLLAILFTYILWRQGAEYKKTFESFLDERRRFIESEIKKSIEIGEINVNGLIEQWQNKMESLNGETKIKAEAELEKLKKIRESIVDSGKTASNLQKGLTYAIRNDGVKWTPPSSYSRQPHGDLLSQLQEQVQALLAQIAALQPPDEKQ
ncbi:MAG: hypothetical protein A2854_00075 [Parcubacteria group bacterium RIFCSPHIGHO2_01_FULL_56_18]|nr:MAG: hypothetical protein A2854_00075 [Parcubacteria group bacterium RIFCSPHIGHO2_01_FULL_56_18]